MKSGQRYQEMVQKYGGILENLLERDRGQGFLSPLESLAINFILLELEVAGDYDPEKGGSK